MNNSFDVIIAGSGVAGSSAAYELSKSKVKTLVIEKEKLPRYKTCGGGVVYRAAGLLNIEIDKVCQCSFNSVNVVDHQNSITIEIERQNPIVYMTMRSELDFALLNKSKDVGAEIIENTSVNEIENNPDGVIVKTKRGKYHAKFLIAADGAAGRISKQLNANNFRFKIPAIESEMHVAGDVFNKFKSSCRFDFGVVPAGYGWVFPKKDHLSVGIAVMRKNRYSLHKLFDEYLETLKIPAREIVKSEKHGFFIPLHPKIKNAVKNRVVFAGDNLGLADPITAEGISFAIKSGKLAAQAVINGDFNPDDVKNIYLKSLMPLKKELKAARFLAWFVYASPAIQKFVFKHSAAKLGELLTDVIMNEKNYSRIINNPFNFLKLIKLFFGRN